MEMGDQLLCSCGTRPKQRHQRRVPAQVQGPQPFHLPNTPSANPLESFSSSSGSTRSATIAFLTLFGDSFVFKRRSSADAGGEQPGGSDGDWKARVYLASFPLASFCCTVAVHSGLMHNIFGAKSSCSISKCNTAQSLRVVFVYLICAGLSEKTAI